MSPVSDDDDRASQGDDDEIPRQGILSAIPKRTFSRVVVLLAMLVGIIYLRQRTASIASCMASSFSIPLPADATRPSAPMKVRVVLPAEPARDPP